MVKDSQTKAKTLPLQKLKVKHFIENFAPKLESQVCRIDLNGNSCERKRVCELLC